jgi:hypothetical protein
VTRPRAADDFATIRARMEELRREQEAAHTMEGEMQSDPTERHARNAYSSQREIRPVPGWAARQSGPIRS